jgi:hypothetical protein
MANWLVWDHKLTGKRRGEVETMLGPAGVARFLPDPTNRVMAYHLTSQYLDEWWLIVRLDQEERVVGSEVLLDSF